MPKVDELEAAHAAEERVGRLEVAVEHALLLHVPQRQQQRAKAAPCRLLRQAALRLGLGLVLVLVLGFGLGFGFRVGVRVRVAVRQAALRCGLAGRYRGDIGEI